MILLKSILKEVDISKIDSVRSGLSKKYGDSLGRGTFGVEFEWIPEKNEFDPKKHKDVIIDLLQKSISKSRDNANDYYEWLEEKRKEYNKYYNGSSRDWDDSYGPIDLETWEETFPEPDSSNYDTEEEFSDARREWREKRDEVEYDHNWWVKRSQNDYIENWAEEKFNDNEWSSYIDFAPEDDINMSQEIIDAREFLDEIGEKSQEGTFESDRWGVGPDGDKTEMRSRILKEEDFGTLTSIMQSFLKYRNTSGDCSAHVHIGLPENFNGFDLLAMVNLVDEKEIVKAVGGDRELDTWSRLRGDLHNLILKLMSNHNIKEGDELDDAKLKDIIKMISSKGYGTTISIFNRYGTIEFRYFASTIKNQPDTFIKWIKYFLLLPKVAQSRNQVKIGNLVFQRSRGNKTKVLSIDSKGKYPKQLGLPSSELRSDTKDDVSYKTIAQTPKDSKEREYMKNYKLAKLLTRK
jgi:hypothetical protein